MGEVTLQAAITAVNFICAKSLERLKICVLSTFEKFNLIFYVILFVGYFEKDFLDIFNSIFEISIHFLW